MTQASFRYPRSLRHRGSAHWPGLNVMQSMVVRFRQSRVARVSGVRAASTDFTLGWTSFGTAASTLAVLCTPRTTFGHNSAETDQRVHLFSNFKVMAVDYAPQSLIYWHQG